MGCRGWNAGQLALWEKLCFSQFTGWNAGKVTEKNEMKIVLEVLDAFSATGFQSVLNEIGDATD